MSAMTNVWRYCAMLLAVPLIGCGGGRVAEAEEAMRRRLNDPASAQFRDTSECKPGGVIRGYVNAKNDFGGYVGFVSFVSDGAIAFASNDRDKSGFIKWTEQCTAEILGHMK